MKFGSSVVDFSVKRPRLVAGIMIVSTLALALLAALPSLRPAAFPFLHPIRIDTDPENMLPKDEPVRVFHDTMKHRMSLYDMVVVGVVNEQDPDGVFNPDSLRRIAELARFAKDELHWQDPNDPAKTIGVISIDVIAPSTVENIRQAGPGTITFEWLMSESNPPASREAAREIRARAERLPFLKDTMLSADGKALCLYLPITSKDLSYKVYAALQEKIATFDGNDQFHITGLPVAEDTFGVEMFKQMAISAPLAMAVIFILMLVFFRRLVLVISPMIVAMVAVIWTMALLIATGQTVHIMSSMIPIFIMPISVLDSVHILSEFFDRYQITKDRRSTIKAVMGTLFVPMLYTSLTTAAGFASLALTPIPPVMVFGSYVAAGVLIAWLWTVTFIPAFVMFIPERWLANFGTVHHAADEEPKAFLPRLLRRFGPKTYSGAKVIMLAAGLLFAIAIYGISRIEINDNPTKWFSKKHPIRVADKILNEHFGGTYMAFLALEAEEQDQTPAEYVTVLSARAGERLAELESIDGAAKVFDAVRAEARRLAPSAKSKQDVLAGLVAFTDGGLDAATDDDLDAWDAAVDFVGRETTRDQTFKQPAVLDFIAKLQQHLLTTGVVGKSNSLTDIVRTVHRELRSGGDEDFRIPDSPNAVAECLIQFENSHRPQDLAHFVTTDTYKQSALWVQLRSGDNRDMARVARAVDKFMSYEPHPLGLKLRHEWFGLTWINVIWQDRMVSGMLQSFLGSFVIVFLMMTALYRSALWGLLSMIPLTVTIVAIYGAMGLVGKDYDMPVAVLSALSLGLAVDYSIHFLSRSREVYLERKSWAASVPAMFGEPARAITRNVIVVGVGFVPLLLAPLVPYKTVGVFIAAILLSAGPATLLILPALIKLLEPYLFPKTERCCLLCNCVTCIVSTIALVAAVVLNIQLFLSLRWLAMGWLSLVSVIILGLACYFTGRSRRCRMEVPIR